MGLPLPEIFVSSESISDLSARVSGVLTLYVSAPLLLSRVSIG